jgi:hypothetical protein
MTVLRAEISKRRVEASRQRLEVVANYPLNRNGRKNGIVIKSVAIRQRVLAEKTNLNHRRNDG